MSIVSYHGIPAPADETRTAAVCRRPDGAVRIAIAARGFVAVVDPESGETRQMVFPDGLVDYPFDCVADAGGMFYVGAGDGFYVLDSFAASFVWWTRTGDSAEMLFALR